ncbi:hypothetical protein V6N13_086638 [Hibiscus sabdariffa]
MLLPIAAARLISLECWQVLVVPKVKHAAPPPPLSEKRAKGEKPSTFLLLLLLLLPLSLFLPSSSFVLSITKYC